MIKQVEIDSETEHQYNKAVVTGQRIYTPKWTPGKEGIPDSSPMIQDRKRRYSEEEEMSGIRPIWQVHLPFINMTMYHKVKLFVNTNELTLKKYNLWHPMKYR